MNEVEKTSREDILKIIEKQKKIKKTIIISAVILGIMIVALAVALTLPNIFRRDNGNVGIKKDPSYVFYKQNYDENIFENDEYMSKNRFIMFKNLETGVTEDISNLSDDKYLVFMSDLVNAIIEGDANKYNSMFSDEYLNANADNIRERFTMQMLYDIVVTRHYTDSGTVYSLEYKIMKNNGSYRSDMPSDCSKAQYFVISEHNGELKIDRLVVN